MPRYDIILTRDVTESKVVSVIASTEEDASEIALGINPTIGWEVDENFPAETYVTDITEVPRYQTRADLMDREAWEGLQTDTAGNPIVWENQYRCDLDHDEIVWHDTWSCQADDDCPACGVSIAPSDSGRPTSLWIGPKDEAEIALWNSLPETQ